jgi:hypothetical protein
VVGREPESLWVSFERILNLPLVRRQRFYGIGRIGPRERIAHDGHAAAQRIRDIQHLIRAAAADLRALVCIDKWGARGCRA